MLGAAVPVDDQPSPTRSVWNSGRDRPPRAADASGMTWTLRWSCSSLLLFSAPSRGWPADPRRRREPSENSVRTPTESGPRPDPREERGAFTSGTRDPTPRRRRLDRRAGPGPFYLDPGPGGPENDLTNRNTAFTIRNLLHRAW